MTSLPPGAAFETKDVWGAPASLVGALPKGSAVLIDRRVARLHPKLRAAISRQRPSALVELTAGEGIKSFPTLSRVLAAMAALPRSGTLLAVGGGTLGDLATVAAHLHRRGITLIHFPTTLLAAVDSSLGGKGAVNHLGRKNAVGVFHNAAQVWLSDSLFTTLSPAQHREGLAEAFKMAACLSRADFEAFERKLPDTRELVEVARRLKRAVCEKDPFEQTGLREVLNFGHTFGHVIESLSRYRIRHGVAVGLGMVCALDVGRALGVTPSSLAARVERVLQERAQVGSRAELAKALSRHPASAAKAILASDKKASRPGEVRMVLLSALGETKTEAVAEQLWRGLYQRWQRG